MFKIRKSAEKYHLLGRDDESHDDDRSSHEAADYVPQGSEKSVASSKTQVMPVSHCLLIALSFLNLFFVALLFSFFIKWGSNSKPLQEATGGVTPYAHLSRDPTAPWPYDTGYGPEVTNHTLLDERWESISFSEGIVAIDHEWARDMNLGPSQNFPWDESKGLYVITAYHTVHCLMTLHRLVYELHHGLPRTRDTDHALHCLAHMRTDAMCEADDFLLPTDRTQYMRRGPRGQPRVCRSWDQLGKWAREHHACYQHISDDEERFAVERDEIERYLGCPPDSPYYETMMKFKTQNGY